MSASASFQINVGSGYGGAGTAADAATSASIDCKLVSISDVYSVAWRIFGTHGVAAPTITLSGNPTGQIASFSVGSSLGQAYGVECKVNGGPDVTGDTDTTSKSAVYVLDADGNRPFFLEETYESDATYGVVPRLNNILLQTGFEHHTPTAVASTPYAVLSTDDVLLVDTGILAAIEVDLPAAASNQYRILQIVDSGGQAAAWNITIDGNGAELVNGLANYVMNVNYESVLLYCNGTAWFILSSFNE